VRDVVENTPLLEKFDDFLVVYADSIFSIDFTALTKRHQSVMAKQGLVTLCYHRPDDLSPQNQKNSNYGVLKLDCEGRILHFIEKPPRRAIAPTDVASTGTFIVNRRALRDLPKSLPLDFSRDVLESLACGPHSSVFGFDIGRGFRYDMGTIEEYVARQFDVLAGLLRLDGVPLVQIRRPSRLKGGNKQLKGCTMVAPPTHVHERATLNGFNVIGCEVSLGSDCYIEDSIIFDRTRIGAGARIVGAIIGKSCSIGDGVSLKRGTILGSHSTVI
jgi:mannose-1-phosphate guanylyltransferase